MQKTALVCGAGGFIGGHLVRRLKSEGFWVRGIDIKFNEYGETEADDFVIGDLREQSVVRAAVDRKFDEVYQLAADMGGAGYIFTGENDADIMHNSATINLNVLDACHKRNIKRHGTTQTIDTRGIQNCHNGNQDKDVLRQDGQNHQCEDQCRDRHHQIV